MEREACLALTLALTGCTLRPAVVPQVCIVEEARTTPAATTPDGCIHVDPALMVELPREVQAAIWAHELRHVDEVRRGIDTSESAADWSSGCELGRRGLDVAPVVEYLTRHNAPGGRYPATTKRVENLINGANFCAGRL